MLLTSVTRSDSGQLEEVEGAGEARSMADRGRGRGRFRRGGTGTGAVAAAPPPPSGGVVDEDDDYTSLGVFLVCKEAVGHDRDDTVVAMVFGIEII